MALPRHHALTTTARESQSFPEPFASWMDLGEAETAASAQALPRVGELGKNRLTYLVHPILTEEHLDRIRLAVAEVLEGAPQ